MDALRTPGGPVLLEALYFAGGLRSKLYGASVRPAWAPEFERVGLQNDVYPAAGQFIADLSRFAHAGPDRRVPVTWYGVYGHAEDLYGDRGVFCGVGLWVAGTSLVDSEPVFDMLLSLVAMLQRARMDDGRPTAEFDATATRALRFVAEPQAWIGEPHCGGGRPPRAASGTHPVYVTLETPLVPGMRVPVDLTAAADVALLAAPATLPERVLFVPATGVDFDARVAPERVLRGVDRLFDAPPRPFLLRALLQDRAALAGRLDIAREGRADADRLARDAREEAVHARRLADDLARRLQHAERATALLPAMDVDHFMERLEGLLDARAGALATGDGAPAPAADPPVASVLATLAHEVGAMRGDLHRLVARGTATPRLRARPRRDRAVAFWAWTAVAVALAASYGAWHLLLR
jgi:hypothetical protein